MRSASEPCNAIPSPPHCPSGVSGDSDSRSACGRPCTKTTVSSRSDSQSSAPGGALGPCCIASSTRRTPSRVHSPTHPMRCPVGLAKQLAPGIGNDSSPESLRPSASATSTEPALNTRPARELVIADIPASPCGTGLNLGGGGKITRGLFGLCSRSQCASQRTAAAGSAGFSLHSSARPCLRHPVNV